MGSCALDISGNGGSDAPAWTASRWFTGIRGVLLLLTLCLTVYLPGFTGIPVVDRDEARFAQASRGMLESGDYVIPRILGAPRLNKPPLIYWLQATTANVLTCGRPLDDAIWMYRLPSLLAGIVTVLATRRLGAAMYTPFVGFLAATMVAVAPVFFWEAHQARADMVMVACTTLATLGLWQCLTREPEREPSAQPRWRTLLAESFLPSPSSLLLWLAVAAGIMTKGPITPMVLGLAALLWALATRQWSRLLNTRPLLGLCVVLALSLPWVALVAQRVGLSQYLHIIHDETVGRSLSPKEGHSGFPGLHTLLMPVLFFPGCLLVGVGIRNAIALSSNPMLSNSDSAETSPSRRDSWLNSLRHTFAPTPGLFLLCILLPSWLIFELIGTRLPHYTMPLYPALALLTARACCISGEAFAALFTQAVVRWALTLWLIEMPLALLAGAGLLAFAVRGVTGIGIGICGLGLAAIFLACAARALKTRDLPRLQLTALVFFASTLAAVGLALPQFEDIWISRGLATQLRALDPGNHAPLAAVGSDAARAITGFQEDSLTFETRGRVQRIDPAQLPAWFDAHPGGLAIVPAQMLVAETRYYPIARTDGFNYSKGKLTYLCIAVRR